MYGNLHPREELNDEIDRLWMMMARISQKMKYRKRRYCSKNKIVKLTMEEEGENQTSEHQQLQNKLWDPRKRRLKSYD